MANSTSFLHKKFLLSATLVGVLLLATYFSVKAVHDGRAIQYLTAVAVKANIEETISSTGVVRASEQVAVGAQVSGQLKSLNVGLGDKVRRGQLLAEIDPIIQNNELLRALAQLQDIRAQREAKIAELRQYQIEESRETFMRDRGASSQADYEQAKSSVEITRFGIESLSAQISMAEIAVATARANLSYTRIMAPIDGEVISVITQAGQTLVSAQTAPVIVVLANLDSMIVKARISEADVIRAKVGQDVYFSILGDPEVLYQSKLRAIESAPDSFANEIYAQVVPQVSTAIYYNGLLDIRNQDRKLRTSMTAQIRIVVNQVKDALTIPVAALEKKISDKQYEVRVRLATGGVETRKVVVGLLNDSNAEVLSGIIEGERVIIGDTVSSAKPAQ